MCINVEEITRILESLGATPDEVAATLNARGIKGVPGASRFANPVVRFLIDKSGIDGWVVGETHPEFLRVLSWGCPELQILMPKPVLAFLEAFHQGGFPALEIPTDA